LFLLLCFTLLLSCLTSSFFSIFSFLGLICSILGASSSSAFLKIKYNKPITTRTIKTIITTFSVFILSSSFSSFTGVVTGVAASLLTTNLYVLVEPFSAYTVIFTIFSPSWKFSFPSIFTQAPYPSTIALIFKDATSEPTVILYSNVFLSKSISYPSIVKLCKLLFEDL